MFNHTFDGQIVTAVCWLTAVQYNRVIVGFESGEMAEVKFYNADFKDSTVRKLGRASSTRIIAICNYLDKIYVAGREGEFTVYGLNFENELKVKI